MRTQIPSRQILDQGIDTPDLKDRAVTDVKLGLTGVTSGTYTKVTVTPEGRITTGYQLELNDLPLYLYTENVYNPIIAEATGVNSIALGYGAYSYADRSIAIGDQSLTRLPGSVMHADGRFASQGDAQSGKYLLRTTTINPFETVLKLQDSQDLLVPDDCTMCFDITIVGHQTNGVGQAAFKLKGIIHKQGADTSSTALLGSISREVLSRSNQSWTADASADNSTGSLKITVKGESGKIIRWFAVVETTEVTN